MEIIPGFEMVGLTLYLKEQNSLVIGDIHMGYEEELNKRGVLLPRFHFKDVVDNITKVFDQLAAMNVKKLDRIIINGDLKHGFGTISDQEWRDTLKFLDLLARHCDKIILIKGNHDIILGPIAKKRSLKLVDDYSIDGIFIAHGHQIPDKSEFTKAKILIIGNEHPAVAIKDTVRKETYKCFLKGKFKDKIMIVMPSFNPVTIGTDVLQGVFISPYLKQNIDNFEIFVVQDKIYPFGRVKDQER